MGALVAALLIGIAGVAAWIGTREMRKIKRTRFVGREPLDGNAFFDLFYKDSGLDNRRVVIVRDAVARALEVPPSLLRPADRFDTELAAAKGWEVWWDDGLPMMRQMGLGVGGKGRTLDWRTIATLDDLIRQVARAP